jgi:hypothetical protein
MTLFLEYCDTEIKYISAGRKDKINKNKYKNDSRTDVQVIDSNWFTTLVRTEGFKVRGHFRLQPYGPKKQYRKLIYIKPFKKKGYKRKFKKSIRESGNN